jgi:hypothetical protein
MASITRFPFKINIKTTKAESEKLVALAISTAGVRGENWDCVPSSGSHMRFGFSEEGPATIFKKIRDEERAGRASARLKKNRA